MTTTASRRDRTIATAVLVALAAILGLVLRDLLSAGPDRLPGLDSPIHYAWEIYTRSVLVTGRLPYWNPYLFSGTPHLADLQMLVFYPPALMLRWLPPAAYLETMVFLHLWLGGAGALMLARTIGLGWPASIVLAVTAMLGGSTAPWLYHGHLLIIFCTAWAPWALMLAIRSVRRGTLLPHPALIAVMVLQFLAGYLQGALYIAGLVGAYYGYSIVWPDRRDARRTRVAAQLVLLVVITVGLSAVQLFPLLRFAAEAERTAGRPYSFAVQDAWSFRHLAMTFFPFVGADTPSAPYRHMLDGVYVGWIATLLVPVAFVGREHRRTAIFFFVAACGAVALALGDSLPVYRLHYLLFPGLRVPGRLLFIARLALAVLGAIGVDRLLAIAAVREWARLRAAAIVSAAAGVAAAVVATRTLLPAMEPTHGWPWLPIGVGIGLIVAVAAARRVGPAALAAAAVVLTVADIAVFAAGGVQTVPTEHAATIRQWIGGTDGGRVWSVCDSVLGGTGLLLASRPSIDGPEGLYLQDYREWLSVVTDDGGVKAALGRRREIVDLTNVSVIASCGALTASSLERNRGTSQLAVYRNMTAAPRAVWTCSPVTLPRREIIERIRGGRFADASGGSQFVNVRWAESVSDEQRRGLESRYHLADGFQRDGRTWRYALRDSSPANVAALVGDRGVEDTSGIERATAVVSGEGNPRLAALELLVTRRPCPQAATVRVLTADQPDGRVVVDVDAPADGGVLFLSEPYYTERRATVDGNPVTVVKANLAFTAVPVPAGRHRVEMRLVPESFYWGLESTAATALGWAALILIARRRAPRLAASAESTATHL
jgi:hypothetical protein